MGNGLQIKMGHLTPALGTTWQNDGGGRFQVPLSFAIQGKTVQVGWQFSYDVLAAVAAPLQFMDVQQCLIFKVFDAIFLADHNVLNLNQQHPIINFFFL